jgi:hypothetical protein
MLASLHQPDASAREPSHQALPRPLEYSVVRFHARTLKLPNTVPATSDSAVADLDAVEARIGRKLPESVREWYSLNGACALLRQYSNDDPPLEVREFGLPQNDTHGGGPHDLLARGLIAFRYENQGVCVWAFGLDGTDDPPAYVDFDSQFKKWTRCTPTFSEHLYAWMWDWAKVLTKDLLVQAQNEPASATALAFLRDNYDVGPETYGWPGHTQYRFSKNDQRILIWAGDDQADWWMTADREESLRSLIETVRHCDQVGQSLWSNSERAESLL